MLSGPASSRGISGRCVLISGSDLVTMGNVHKEVPNCLIRYNKPHKVWTTF